MNYGNDVIRALAWLRKGWDGDNSERAIAAFDTLDNAGVFATLDEQTEYASAEEILVEVARRGPVVLPMTGTAPVAARRLDEDEWTDMHPANQRARCRGCSGTCCTGVGSEPCTC